MTIEKMKMWLDAMENELAVDFMDAVAVGEAAEKLCDAIASLRQAIAAAEKEKALQSLHAENERLGLYKDAYAEQEPVAWIHIMDNTEGIKANGKGIVSITQKRKHPFGKPGLDFSKSYPVTSTPLYTHPPQRTEQEPVIDKSAAIRIATALGWEPKREWVGLTRKEVHDLYDSDYVVFHQRIEAKLKEKNT